MKIDKSQVDRILVITLSNTGDVILTTPVVKALSKEFPAARIDVMVGPRGKEIFEKDPKIFKLIIYDKHMSIAQKRRLQLRLKNLKYDLVVDLRNTLFPLLIGPKFRTSTIVIFPSSIVHRKKRHLYRLKSVGIDDIDEESYIHIPKEDEEWASRILKEEKAREPIVVVCPGAKSHLKRWPEDGFAEVSDRLIKECGADIVFAGSEADKDVVDSIIRKMKKDAHNLAGRTSVRQLAGLLKRAKLLITNDSAPLHLGCAVGAKVLALFGPTDPKKYGPTGEFDTVISQKLFCSPCESAECKYNYECMKSVSAGAVFDAAKEMLEGYV